MRIIWIFFALIIFVGPSHAQAPKFKLATQRSVLERADRVVQLFSYARTIKTAAVFSEAQKRFHDTYFGYLKIALKASLRTKLIPPEDRATVEITIEALDRLQSVDEFIDDFLLYLCAVTPSSISNFYGYPQFAGKKFEAGADRIQHQTGWVINQTSPTTALLYFVTLHSPGSGERKVPTPQFLAGNLAKKLLANKVPIVRATLEPIVKDGIAKGLGAAATYLQSVYVNDFGFRVDSRWLNSREDAAVVAPQQHEIFIGDKRVVRILPWNTAPFGLYDPPVQNPNLIPYGIRGIRGGTGTIVAVFQPEFEALGFGGLTNTYPMVVEVLAPNQSMSPNVAQPMPVLRGNPQAPILAPPALSPPRQPSPLPPTPAPPVAAQPPPLPRPGLPGAEPAPWSPCGKPEDGGTFSPYTHTCEYAKGGSAPSR
jgi:hypothetical protein